MQDYFRSAEGFAPSLPPPRYYFLCISLSLTHSLSGVADATLASSRRLLGTGDTQQVVLRDPQREVRGFDNSGTRNNR